MNSFVAFLLKKTIDGAKGSGHFYQRKNDNFYQFWIYNYSKD